MRFPGHQARSRTALAVLAALFLPSVSSAEAPRPIAPAILSTPLDERSVAFSKDGRTAIFSVRVGDGYLQVLCASVERNGRWSEPRVLPFSGLAKFDGDPYFSPDGSTLYFASSRSDAGGNGPLHIWSVARSGTGWGRPRRVQGLGSAQTSERSPVVMPSGRIYFAGNRDGRTQLYRADPGHGRFGQATALPAAINDDGENVALAVSPREDLIVFASIGRADEILARGENYPRGDLYLSRETGGRWGKAVQLPRPINSAAADLFPSFSADGRWLYFMSERGFATDQDIVLTAAAMRRGLESRLNGRGNIYRIEARALDRFK